uniref:Uncharacterized protein n=1 Tax=Cyanistes caeruleus TaxID=156563 RepID=A0A8C0Z838_CYACU
MCWKLSILTQICFPEISEEVPEIFGKCLLLRAAGDISKAARRGEIRQLQQLIESGACVNALTYDSITPLHEASLRGQAQCVKMLLDAGAQVCSHP